MKLTNSIIRLFLILQILLFAPFLLIAGAEVKKEAVKVKHPLVLKTDTQGIKIQQFEPKKLKNLSDNPDFKYDKANTPGISLWAQFRHWLWEHFFKNVFGTSESGDFFYYLFIALGVVFAIYVVFKVTGISAMQVIRGTAKTISVPYTESLENIHELDFDNEIDKAIANANYRLAVRLLYLSSLKYLSDKSLISWQIEKTNTEYINELPEGNKRQIFNSLTQQFEYVWYGNFYVDVNTFQSIRSLFQQFKQTL